MHSRRNLVRGALGLATAGALALSMSGGAFAGPAAHGQHLSSKNGVIVVKGRGINLSYSSTTVRKGHRLRIVNRTGDVHTLSLVKPRLVRRATGRSRTASTRGTSASRSRSNGTSSTATPSTGTRCAPEGPAGTRRARITVSVTRSSTRPAKTRQLAESEHLTEACCISSARSIRGCAERSPSSSDGIPKPGPPASSSFRARPRYTATASGCSLPGEPEGPAVSQIAVRRMRRRRKERTI